ncbi:MAG: OmpA family protein [Flavobacteriales bacterium]
MIGISAGHRLKLCLLVLAVFALQRGNAQDQDSEPFSTLKKRAKAAEKANDIHGAVSFLELMVEARPEHYPSHLILARLSSAIRDYTTAYSSYQACIEIDSEREPAVHYELAVTLKNLGKYPEAKTAFDSFVKKYKRNDDVKTLKKSAQQASLSCDSALIRIEQQQNVEINRLPNQVNGPHIEFNPFYLSKNQLVYGALKETEVKRFDKDSITPVRSFYSAIKTEDGWEDQGLWNPQISSEIENTGNGCFNADSTLFFFSKCEEEWTGKVTCKIYQSEYAEGLLSEPTLLDESINYGGSSNSQPAVGYESKMGRMLLYFVSDREGGRGGKDMWVAQYDERKKKFKAAKNLGRKLNSEDDEITPFYDNVKKKLYYSSNNVLGQGGFDVYEVRGENRKWGLPKNVGYPVNTNADEVYFRVNPMGNTGLFTSNRAGSSQMFHPTCCDDIYEFEFRDYVILALKGSIFEVSEADYIEGKADEISNPDELEKIPDAEISIYLKEDGEEVLISELESSELGEYFLQLEEGQDYRIEVSKNAYYSNFLEISTKERTFSDTLFVNMGLAQVSTGSILIPNIYYDFDSANLTEESRQRITSTLLQVLTENPKFRIEIGSHTDSRGADDYNMKLSQKRAESVVKFLVKNGITKNRLEAQGYGETIPVAPNTNEDGSDNPEGRQLNRRTEFKILDLNSGSF